MLTYNQLIERRVSEFGHRDSNDRVDKDLASHGFKRVPASNDPADAGTHTRWALQRMKGKSGPKGEAGQAKGVNKGKSNLDHAAPGSKRINTVKREGDVRPTHLGKGSTGKKGEIDKVGRKSNVLAMKQHWQDNNVPSPEKREEMKAGIGKPKKKTHDHLQSPSSRPSDESRKEMKRKALKKEHTEWWLDAFRLDENINRMKEIERIDSNKPGQDLAAKQRAQRNQASRQRVADAESKARVGAPERRAQAQATSDRAARNASSRQRVADAERKARGPVTAKGAGLGGQKQTMSSTSRPANTVKAPSGFKKGTNSLRTSQTSNGPTPTPTPTPSRTPASRPTSAEKSRLEAAARRNAAADKRSRERAADSEISKRKSGVSGGVKSALGGDVIGMGRKAGDTPEMDEKRKEMNRKAKGDFAKKKVQQTGNLAKSAVGKTYSALTSKGKSGEDVETGSESGNVSGGSEFASRTKRG